MVVPFAPGGATDIAARMIAQKLTENLGKQVFVENRAGANGAIAASQLAKLPADGQTLMMIVSGHITNPLVSPSAGYDALKDFTSICLLASSPLLIFAHPSFAANDMKGTPALAKEKPGTLGHPHPAGCPSHLRRRTRLVGGRIGVRREPGLQAGVQQCADAVA